MRSNEHQQTLRNCNEFIQFSMRNNTKCDGLVFPLAISLLILNKDLSFSARACGHLKSAGVVSEYSTRQIAMGFWLEIIVQGVVDYGLLTSGCI